MYNEFPDFENVNVGRLQRWWTSHKHQTIFQTDRLRIKTSDKFVETYESYKKIIGDRSQSEYFETLLGYDEVENYKTAYVDLSGIRNVGRFTLFIYLEMISVLTNFTCWPDKIEWKYADNCRKGLCYHLGIEDSNNYPWLDKQLDSILVDVKSRCDHDNIFNVETTLCAYKKFRHGKRYIGYYIDRQFKEIETMKNNVTTGVAWRVMDEFRKETYKHLYDDSDINNRCLRDWQNLGNETVNLGI